MKCVGAGALDARDLERFCVIEAIQIDEFHVTNQVRLLNEESSPLHSSGLGNRESDPIESSDQLIPDGKEFDVILFTGSGCLSQRYRTQ